MIAEFDGAGPHAAVISILSSAFDEGRTGPDTTEVLARGRQLQRRKRAMPALGLGAVAVSASLAVALAGPAGTGAGHTLRAGSTAVNVDNAAFSVHTDSTTGEITVTVRQFSDQNELKRLLTKAGVRTVFASQTVAVVGHGETVPTCTWPGASRLSPNAVLPAPQPADRTTGNVFTIDPSKMPSGSVLAFEYFRSVKGTAVVMTELLSREPTGCGPSTAIHR